MNDITVTADLGMPTGISLRDPDVILAEAGERAKALTRMVEQTRSYTQIGPSKHLRVEAWITVGQFYGCSARTISTEDVQINGVLGFKAHARVTSDATGAVLSEAEALCMQDEKNWDNKPLHQLMSMAQTRAISKALAIKFRWVVTLGGFAPTPAEEMTLDCEPPTPARAGTVPPLKIVQAPVFPYGFHKGKLISDASVPMDYLHWLSGKTAEGLANPERARFKSQDQLFLSALDAEVRSRQPLLPDVPAPVAMNDGAWADFLIMASEDWMPEYTLTLAEFGLTPKSPVDPLRRTAISENLLRRMAAAAQ